MIQAGVIHVTNPFRPMMDRRIFHVGEEQTIAEWLKDGKINFDKPTICMRNGEAVLRDEYATIKIENGDAVAFITLPEGGGGSNPLAIVLMIALVVAAPYAATLMVSGSVGGSATAFAIAKAGIILAGSMLINALVPPPKPPAAQSYNVPSPSPTYSLGAQGNSARLQEPIPVQYGRHIAWPDFAAQPYVEFSGNEQYLYQLFCIGQGYYQVESVRFEDTPVGNFEEVEYEIVEPGENVTLFPTNVETAGEISGQELLLNVPVEAVANTSGSNANAIGIDIVLSKGLFYANDSGGLSSRSVSWRVSVLQVGANGTALPGAVWTVIANESITAATSTPIRRSYKYRRAQHPVITGRLMVRLERTNAKDESSRVGNDLNWASLRAYMPDAQNYGNVTLMAMRVKASNNISEQSSRKVNVVATRKLPTWNPTTGWSQPTATRSIAWALADMIRSNYGGDQPDSAIDLNTLYSLNATWNARGDYFDARFDQRGTIWEALNIVARAGRAIPVMQAGIISFVRDQQQSINTAMFTTRNIVNGTFSVNYLMPAPDSADAVEVEYVDSATWKVNTVICQIPGGTTLRPAKVRLFGCTTRAHAYREGLYMAAANARRRRLISFDTELDAHVPMIGDVVAVSHDMPAWGTAGELTGFSYSGGITTLDLSEPVTFQDGVNNYIALRKRDGSVSGLWLCTPGADDKQVIVTQALDFTPYVGDSEERTHFAFGSSENWSIRARVLKIKPKNNGRVAIELVNEDDAVHIADTNGPVPNPPTPSQLPSTITAPQVTNLVVTQSGSPLAPILNVSWTPAPNADHYIIEESIDGAFFTHVADVWASSYSFRPAAGVTSIRVAAIGLTRGPWAYWVGTPGSEVSPPGNVINLRLREPFTGTALKVMWNPAARASSYTVQVWAAGTLRRTVSDIETLSFDYTHEMARADGGPWRTYTIRVVAVGTGQSDTWAELADVTNAQVGQLNNITLVAGIRNITLNCDAPTNTPDFAGIKVWISTTDGFTPDAVTLAYTGPDTSVYLPINSETAGTWYVRVAGYDVWGVDSLNYSGQFTVTLNTPQVILSELAGQIMESELHQSLQERLTAHDAKTTNYYQPTMPAGVDYTDGDMWFDTDDNYHPYIWNLSATTWLDARDYSVGGNNTYFQPTQPTGGNYVTGDLWFDTDDNNNPYRFDQTLNAGAGGWQNIRDGYIEAAVAAEANIRLNADNLLGAEYTIKADINGHVAGIGLAVEQGASGAISSSFIVRSDQFAVVLPSREWAPEQAYTAGQYTRPTEQYGPTGFIYKALSSGSTGIGTSEPVWPTVLGGTIMHNGIAWEAVDPLETVPFIVGSVNGVPSVVMSNALIGDATITMAHIVDDIQSTNFVTGANGTGWRLRQNGSLEINSGTIRATLQSSNFVAGSAGWRLLPSGNIEVNAGTFRGTLDGADGEFSGVLSATTVNAVNTLNLAGNAVTVAAAQSLPGTQQIQGSQGATTYLNLGGGVMSCGSGSTRVGTLVGICNFSGLLENTAGGVGLRTITAYLEMVDHAAGVVIRTWELGRLIVDPETGLSSIAIGGTYMYSFAPGTGDRTYSFRVRAAPSAAAAARITSYQQTVYLSGAKR